MNKFPERSQEVQILWFTGRKKRVKPHATQLKLKKTIVALCNEILHPLNGILGSTELIEGHITDLTRNLKSPDATTINKALTILLNINKSIAAIKTCTHHHKIITHDLLELAKLEVNTEQVEV